MFTKSDITTLQTVITDKLQHARACSLAWSKCVRILLIMPELGDSDLKQAVYDGNVNKLKEFYKRWADEADQVRHFRGVK